MPDLPKIPVSRQHFMPTGPILRACDFETWCQADAFFRETKQQAEALLTHAESEAENLKNQGYLEGFQQGEVEFLRQLAEGAKRIDAVVDQLNNALPDLVLNCIQKIMGEIGPRDLTLSKVAYVIGQLRDHNRLKLSVAPGHVDDVRDWLRTQSFADSIDVKPAPDLYPGDLIVESNNGLIDATIHTQLSKLREALGADTPDKSISQNGEAGIEEVRHAI